MPVLIAVSGSTQHLYRLLRCLNFAPRARVQLSREGIQFSVEDSRAIQGLAFLNKSLFTSFRFEDPTHALSSPEADDGYEPPTFQISLGALLETLSIFGAADSNKERFPRDPYTSGITHARSMGPSAAFDSRVLGMPGLCRIGYRGLGDPLDVTLEEGNMTTTCSLTTYEPELYQDIPFDRDALTLKAIMRGSLLFDAIQELSFAGAERLTLSCRPTPCDSALSLSVTGNYGSINVDIKDEQQLLETFQCQEHDANVYKFSMIKAASRAMAAASKVSIRMDIQGVLSLQFMIELSDTEDQLSFVDFRFVPLVEEAGDRSDDDANNDAVSPSQYGDQPDRGEEEWQQ